MHADTTNFDIAPVHPAADVEPPSATRSKCPFARLFGNVSKSLADRLREQTKAAHARAERHPLQARLIRGEISRDEYAAYLCQLRCIWCALDAVLAELAARDIRVAAMLRPYHAHTGRIDGDLRFLGVAPQPALPVTARFIHASGMLNAAREISVLGVWYVLEGSTNGGRFIAKAVSRGLGIAGPEGLATFDPHGAEQSARWQAWRAALDAQGWTESERDRMVAAATETFEFMHHLMDGVDRAAMDRTGPVTSA